METNIENDSENPSSPPAIIDSDPPFDGVYAKADVILRSFDLVDFHVIKAFLALASSVFEDMFALREPLERRPEEVKNDLSIIVMQEQSETIRMLLLFCYPGNAPVLGKRDILAIHAAHAAASKYCMDEVKERIQVALLSSPLMEQQPLRIFAIAVHYRWEEVARASARNAAALTVPFYTVEELQYISGREYGRLLDYHQQCALVASRVACTGTTFRLRFFCTWTTWALGPASERFVWFRGSHPEECPSMTFMVSDDNICVCQWWLDYMVEAGSNLALRPVGNTVMEPVIVDKALQRATGCPVCRETVHADMRAFIEMFAAEVDKVISKVNSWLVIEWISVNYETLAGRVKCHIFGPTAVWDPCHVIQFPFIVIATHFEFHSIAR